MSICISSAICLLGAIHDLDIHLFRYNERMTFCSVVTLLVTPLMLGIIRLQNQM
jgi:hypothetical protein